MFHIRKARLEDAEEIASVHIKTWKSTYSELLNEQDLSNTTFENRKTLWETILKMPDQGQVSLVLHEDNGKIIGFISGGKERTKRFGYEGEIYSFYLLDEYQRKGLGTKLLKDFCEHMHSLGYQSLLVWVLTQNPSSAFYKNLGAKQVEKEETTIGKGTYQESAFGWQDMEELKKRLHKKTWMA